MRALRQLDRAFKQNAVFRQLPHLIIHQIIDIVALRGYQLGGALQHQATRFQRSRGGQRHQLLTLRLEAQFARLFIGRSHQIRGFKQSPLIGHDGDSVAVGQRLGRIDLSIQLIIHLFRAA